MQTYSFSFIDWKFHLNLAGSELPLVSIDKMQDVLRQTPGSIMESAPFQGGEVFKKSQKTELIR